MTATRDEDCILVAANYQLVNVGFYRERVWLPAREADKDLPSRMAWLDALYLIYDYEGRLYFSDKRPYNPPEIEEVFTDPSNRWMSYFLQADETGNRPALQSRKFERLRMIELYCRLMKSERWIVTDKSRVSSKIT